MVINEAETNLPDLEKMILDVFANNSLAKGMYEKFGVVEYGMLPNGIKLEKGYSDRVLMYRVIKR